MNAEKENKKPIAEYTSIRINKPLLLRLEQEKIRLQASGKLPITISKEDFIEYLLIKNMIFDKVPIDDKTVENLKTKVFFNLIELIMNSEDSEKINGGDNK